MSARAGLRIEHDFWHATYLREKNDFYRSTCNRNEQGLSTFTAGFKSPAMVRPLSHEEKNIPYENTP